LIDDLHPTGGLMGDYLETDVTDPSLTITSGSDMSGKTRSISPDFVCDGQDILKVAQRALRAGSDGRQQR
jgi:hypothetical protein